MYEYLQGKGVLRTRENECWTYLLEDYDKFSNSGYKSAQLQLKECMLKCAVIKFNGQLKLIYFPDRYKNLVEILSTIPSNKIWIVLEKILESVIKIKKYGYLSCSNIDINPDSIYIDPQTLEAHLIYLPLGGGNTPQEQRNFEVALRRNFTLALREANNHLVADREQEFFDVLNYSGQNLEELLQVILQQSGNGSKKKTDGIPSLICNSKMLQLEYSLEKEETKIGRSKSSDIVIDFTNQISRLHCMVIRKNEKIFLRDEASTHGTFLNGKRCEPKKLYELHDKDTIALINPQGLQITLKM